MFRLFSQLSGSTSSVSTGPQGAASGSYYVYCETTSPNYPGATYDMYQNFGETVSSVTFYYNMYGDTMGTAYLQGSTTGSSWTSLWAKSGNVGSSSWYSATVAPSSTYTWLRFYYTGGSSYTGDFALDYISVSVASTTTESFESGFGSRTNSGFK